MFNSLLKSYKSSFVTVFRCVVVIMVVMVVIVIALSLEASVQRHCVRCTGLAVDQSGQRVESRVDRSIEWQHKDGYPCECLSRIEIIANNKAS